MNSKLTEKEKIEELIAKLEPKAGSIVNALRQIILETDPEIGEQVKWNSPSFYYTGEMEAFDPKTYKRDIVVINLHRGKVLLVFPTAATLADQLDGKNYKDGRKIISINSLSDVHEKEHALRELIVRWLKAVEKP